MHTDIRVLAHDEIQNKQTNKQTTVLASFVLASLFRGFRSELAKQPLAVRERSLIYQVRACCGIVFKGSMKAFLPTNHTHTHTHTYMHEFCVRLLCPCS